MNLLILIITCSKKHIHEYNLITSAGDDSCAIIGYTTPIYDINDATTYKMLTGIPYYNFENTLVLSYGMNEIHHYIIADTVASLRDYIFSMECYPYIGVSLYIVTKHDKIYIDRLNNAHVISKDNTNNTIYIDNELRVFD